jgi:hypothetical protein
MAKATYAASAGPLVHTGRGKLVALLLTTASTGAVSIVIYDNTAASGTILMTIVLNPGESPTFLRFPDDIPLTFTTGLYLGIPAQTTVYAWAIGF